ncbi:MAG: replication initiator protein A [Bilifractor sp.]
MLMDLLLDSYSLPSQLVKEDQYNCLTDSAKILYGILLQKYIEAARGGNRDRSGKVYINYSQRDMAADLHCSTRSIRRFISELKRAGLIDHIKKNAPGTNGSIYLNVVEAF